MEERETAFSTLRLAQLSVDSASSSQYIVDEKIAEVGYPGSQLSGSTAAGPPMAERPHREHGEEGFVASVISVVKCAVWLRPKGRTKLKAFLNTEGTETDGGNR